MKRFVVCFLGILLIILALGCNSQQEATPQQVTIAPTVTALPTPTAIPTPHPLAITVENVSSLKLLKIIGAGRVNDVAWSPKGDVIAVAQDFDISFYDSASLQFVESIGFGGTEVVFSLDGLFIAIAEDKKVVFWDMNKRTVNQEIAIDMARIDDVVYNSSGTSLAVLGDSRITGGDPNSVLELWNVETLKRVYTNRETWEANMAFSLDGETLAFISNAGLLLIQSDTGEQQKIDLTWEGGSLAYINDYVLLKRLDYNQLKTIDLVTFKTLDIIGVDGSYSEFIISPDKKKIVFPNVRDKIQVWDLATKSLLYELNYYSHVTRIDFNPDSSYFISVDYGDNIRIHNLGTGKIVEK